MPLTQVDQGLLSSTAQYTGFKNRLINGGFQVWQRGTSASVTNAAVYNTADRWLMGAGGTCTVAQSATVDSPNGNYSLVITTTAGSSYVNPIQAIERLNVFALRGKNVTFSFWVKLNSGTWAGQIGANIYYSNSSDVANISSGLLTPTLGSQYATPTNTWQQVKATYLIPADAVGLSCTPQLTLAQANGVSWSVADCQLEIGSVATSFDYRPYGTELALCQRYFQFIRIATQGYANAAMDTAGSTSYPVTMRAAPTITWTVNFRSASAPASGASYVTYNNDVFGTGVYGNVSGAGNYYWYLTGSCSSEL